MKRYHLIVIGAGSGGLVAAEFASKLGAKVALVEAQKDLGGECLHAGCVPSKALIHAARTAWAAGHSQALGTEANPRVDFSQVERHITGAIQTITENHDNDSYYQSLGVDVIHGKAAFIDEQTIEVNGQSLVAKRFIVATGSKPLVPDIPGLTDGPYLTNETVFDLDSLPESLLVVGGGPIGCELGQAFAMLGSKVTILQAASRLLPHDEPEAADILARSLKAMGVNVLLDAQIDRVTYRGSTVSVNLQGGQNLRAYRLLVATGRAANIPMGTENAQVQTTRRGIKVNERLRTTNKRIYAIGDCNGGMQFTHVAGQQAVVAVQNALMGLHKKFDGNNIPWATFTTPEIAHLGATKAELNANKTSYKKVTKDFSSIDKAIAEGEKGYIELLVADDGNILGATVAGANAAEILGQIVTAKHWNNFKGIMQAYPTYGLGIREAAADVNLNTFLNSPIGKITGRYVQWRGQ